jgi:hypothetical protein
MNFARRLARLETARGPFDPDGIATMNDKELRAFVARTLQEFGGQDAALSALRADPATDPDTLKWWRIGPHGLFDPGS